MTHGALRVSAIVLGMAAFVSIIPLSTASADSSAPSGATPSLSEPAPTPSVTTPPTGSASTSSGVAGGGAAALGHPSHTDGRHYAHSTRHTHYAWRNGHRYRHDRNPVAAATNGVVGGMEDLGSIAAYPFYCFPRYGSCPVYLPYP